MDAAARIRDKSNPNATSLSWPTKEWSRGWELGWYPEISLHRIAFVVETE